jgi:hypothetical protein
MLAELDSSIPKIAIVTGDDDALINPERSKELKAHMPVSIAHCSFVDVL